MTNPLELLFEDKNIQDYSENCQRLMKRCLEEDYDNRKDDEEPDPEILKLFKG